MEKKKVIKLQIISALIWAATIIACSYALNGAESGKQVVNILIAGATMHILLYSSKFVKGKAVAKQ